MTHPVLLKLGVLRWAPSPAAPSSPSSLPERNVHTVATSSQHLARTSATSSSSACRFSTYASGQCTQRAEMSTCTDMWNPCTLPKLRPRQLHGCNQNTSISHCCPTIRAEIADISCTTKLVPRPVGQCRVPSASAAHAISRRTVWAIVLPITVPSTSEPLRSVVQGPLSH